MADNIRTNGYSTPNGCVRHCPHPNHQHRKWVRDWTPARVPFLFACGFRSRYLTNPRRRPRVDFGSMVCVLPHSLVWVIHVTAVSGSGTRELYRGRRELVQARLRRIQHCNMLHSCETGSKFQTLIIPSHIALSCSGVFVVEGEEGTAEAGLFSSKAGLTSLPTLLGIRAVPSAMAEKFMPMNRSIMS